MIDVICKIRFLSETVEGKRNDKKLADETDCILPDGSKLCQDTGFQGFTLENVAILQPKKKTKGKSLSDLDKSINQWHSSLRIRVEHAIGGVKRYRIVKDKIRNWKPGFKDSVFETCCGLHNFRLNFRPWTYKPIQLHLFVNF
ncbi:MAG: transposase family protein [Proteobacteria bacterium]|nr:transposase family protein [Pseudomonadota bacterium]